MSDLPRAHPPERLVSLVAHITIATYGTEDAVRATIADIVQSEIERVLRPRFAYLYGVQVTGVDLTDQWATARNTQPRDTTTAHHQ